MAKAIKTADLLKMLAKANCDVRECKGSHAVVRCSCGQHSVTIATGHRETSPALVRKVRQGIACVEWGF